MTYNDGAVLAELPESDAPCAIIYGSSFTGGYNLFFASGFSYYTENDAWKVRINDGAIHYVTDENGLNNNDEYGWDYKGEVFGGFLLNIGSPNWDGIKWVKNTDLLNEDGTIAHAATVPIPVGEIVDTINDIPIYEDLR